MERLSKNAVYTVTIDGYSSDGAGVCRIGGRAVFVKGALIGETWEIKLVKVSNSAVFARGERLLCGSPERTAPECPAFGRCGGCDLCHMSYTEELRYKLQRVNDALQRIAGADFAVKEIVGSEKTDGYRNKAIYAVGQKKGGIITGFFRPRTHEVVPVERCRLQPELSDRAAAAVRMWAKQRAVPVYDESDDSGILRHIFVRSAANTQDAVVCVVLADSIRREQAEFLVSGLREACPELTGIALCINRTRGNTVLTGRLHTLWGRAEITDVLCGFRYEISPFAFFQINPPQAERLYRRALCYAALKKNDMVLDLYCGAGTITLCLAREAGKAIGAEIVPEAVRNARENAVRNGVKNVEFICADASKAAKTLACRNATPRVIVVDPPRKGLAPEVLDTMAMMEPERIVYVSCDPATMARDIKCLSAHGYCLTAGTAFDLFPRCAHVETVCLLVRRNGLHINIDVDVEEMLQDKRGQATYPQIKEYVLEQTGMKVSSLYISQVKRKCGLDVSDSYNKPKSEDAHVPQCPPEKEKAIMDALRHFGLIS